MSGKSRRRTAPYPLGGYQDIARAAHPNYVRKDAPCDVPMCSKLVSDRNAAGTYGGGRTFTWLTEDGESLSILIRLCPDHFRLPMTTLQCLLPRLAEMGAVVGYPAYIDLRDEEDQ